MRILITVMLLLLGTTMGARAQSAPSYAQQTGEQQIRGRIVSYNGRYNLVVRDEKGYDDNVILHEGTVINPTGLTLAPGMVVSILGYNDGPTFAANDIDTPYTYYGGVPYYEGHPWTYYGPGINLGFYFDNPVWWHGDVLRGPYGYDGYGHRFYPHADVGGIYRNHPGSFHGRDFVAPHESGGFHAHVGGGRPPR